jgi:hypothetical protein
MKSPVSYLVAVSCSSWCGTLASLLQQGNRHNMPFLKPWRDQISARRRAEETTQPADTGSGYVIRHIQ